MVYTQKSLKTCLRYPGGKSRACIKMDPYFPDLRDYKEYREPFLGGGSVAIHIAKKYPSLDIWVNDLYNPLYTFWCILRDKPQDLYECIKETKAEHNTPELARKLFEESKVSLNHEETWDFYRAVAFYIINKCCFSGLTENSSFSPQASESNFSMRGIEKLPEYSKIIKDWKITNLSYEQLLTDDTECFTLAISINSLTKPSSTRLMVHPPKPPPIMRLPTTCGRSLERSTKKSSSGQLTS